MAINALNKKVTGATTSAALGPVTTGKEWIIKLVAAVITSSGTAAGLFLEVDGVKVAEHNSFGPGTDSTTVLVGGVGANVIPNLVIANAGQTVNVVRGSGGAFTFSAHMSYLERDIPV